MPGPHEILAEGLRKGLNRVLFQCLFEGSGPIGVFGAGQRLELTGLFDFPMILASIGSNPS